MRLPSKKPRYPLQAAQAAVLQIGESCAAKANLVLLLTPQEARVYIQTLVRNLTPSDFAHTELMPQRAGKPRYGDVYGKQNDDALWFVKLEFDGSTTTVIMSCHEAEYEIELATGITLRRKET